MKATSRLLLAVLSLWILLILGCSPSSKTPSGIELPTYCVSFSSFESIDSLPAPTFKAHIGNSHLQVTTTHADAQKWFDQGLNLLHGFWHAQAYRAFKTALTFDPDMAMGWWGIAMCQPGFGDTDRAVWVDAISKAVKLSAHTTPLEQQLIAATDLLVGQGVNVAGPTFQRLWDAFPNEPEIAALSSVMVRYSMSDLLGADGERLKSRMEAALRQFPDHNGLQHYYIHLLESRPDFALALPYAERMAAEAHQSPHLLHMPGHLYFLAGDYDRAVEVFHAAVKADEQWHSKESVAPAADANYMHDLHYLAVAEAERNEYQRALAFAQQYAELALRNTYLDAASMSTLYEGRMLPILVHIRFRKWAAAQRSITDQINQLTPVPNTEIVQTYLRFMLLYCEGMAAIEQNDVATATQKGGAANQLLQTFNQMGTQMQGSMAFKNVNEAFDIMSMSLYELAGWIDNINPDVPFNVHAWDQAFELEAAIPYDEPPRLMYPIGESLGSLHLRRNEPEAANVAFNRALLKRPRSPLIRARMGGGVEIRDGK